MSKTKKINGFSWDGFSYVRQVKISSGSVKLTITCEEENVDFIKKFSDTMVKYGKAWPSTQANVAKAVTRFLSDVGNYAEVYGEINVDDLSLVNINATLGDEKSPPHCSYLIKLIRAGEIVLDEGQYLEIATDLGSRHPVELITL